MAPTIAKTQNVTSPKTASTSQPTFAQVGQLATTAQTAATTVNELKTQLKAADAAFKAAPKNAVLGAKVKKLLEQTKAAMATQEKADQSLANALTSLVGKGTPREQAAALTKLLTKLEPQLSAAGKAQGVATDQFTRDVAAAGNLSTKALAKAEASQKKAAQAATTFSQLTAAKSAIESAIGNKEKAALEKARADQIPGAKDVVDLTDLANKSREEQVRLVGAPVVGVTKEAAIAQDLVRINQAMTRSPESAARMLQQQLERADPGQQEALMKAAAPQIKLMVTAAQGIPAVASVLLDTLKITRSGAREALVNQLAAGTGVPFSPVMTQLQGRLQKGEGLIEAVALRDAFKTSKPGFAKSIEGPLTTRVEALKADFAKSGEKVKKLNTDLARLVVGFGPMLAGDKRQAAIEGFKNRHKAEYAAWEAAGANLAPAVQYALEHNDPRLAAMLPDFLSTRAGEDSMMQALAQQSAAKPSLLDHVPQLVKQGNEGAKLAGHVSTALVKGVAMKAIELTRAGKLDEAQKLLGGLQKNATLFGLSGEAMEKLTAKMGDVLGGGGENAVKALTQEFKDVEAGTPGFVDRRAQALKGLGLALSAFAVADKVGQFGSLSIKEQVGTVAEGLGVGVDGGLLAMEVIGRANPLSKVLMLGKSVSAAAGAVAAVMDGISAVQAFREGKHAEGVASSASAVGGAILATAAFTAAAGAQVVPVAGQVIGAVLVIGGTIAKWAIEDRRAGKAEDAIEADAKAFLEAGGVDAAAANELKDLLRDDGRNVGPFIQQVANAIGMPADEFFKHVKGMKAPLLEAFVKMSKDWPVDSRGQFKRTGPKSLEVALIWMREDGMMPAGK